MPEYNEKEAMLRYCLSIFSQIHKTAFEVVEPDYISCLPEPVRQEENIAAMKNIDWIAVFKLAAKISAVALVCTISLSIVGREIKIKILCHIARNEKGYERLMSSRNPLLEAKKLFS